MEKDEITVQGYELGNDKVVVSASAIVSELEKLKGVSKSDYGDKIIYFSKYQKNCELPTDYEYVDNDYDFESDVSEMFSKIITCIKDGTKILGRRKKDGKTR